MQLLYCSRERISKKLTIDRWQPIKISCKLFNHDKASQLLINLKPFSIYICYFVLFELYILIVDMIDYDSSDDVGGEK